MWFCCLCFVSVFCFCILFLLTKAVVFVLLCSGWRACSWWCPLFFSFSFSLFCTFVCRISSGGAWQRHHCTTAVVKARKRWHSLPPLRLGLSLATFLFFSCSVFSVSCGSRYFSFSFSYHVVLVGVGSQCWRYGLSYHPKTERRWQIAWQGLQLHSEPCPCRLLHRALLWSALLSVCLAIRLVSPDCLRFGVPLSPRCVSTLSQARGIFPPLCEICLP